MKGIKIKDKIFYIYLARKRRLTGCDFINAFNKINDVQIGIDMGDPRGDVGTSYDFTKDMTYYTYIPADPTPQEKTWINANPSFDQG